MLGSKSRAVGASNESVALPPRQVRVVPTKLFDLQLGATSSTSPMTRNLLYDGDPEMEDDHDTPGKVLVFFGVFSI
jgi:hypothetical protein